MSSFSYLWVTPTFEPDSASWEDGALKLGVAKYRVPVLWVALMDASGPRRMVDDDVVFASPMAEGIARLRARVERLASWLTGVDVGGYAAHLATLLEQEQEDEDDWIMLDISEVAGMVGDEVHNIERSLAWLDGDDQVDPASSLHELSGLSPATALPPAGEGLEDACSHDEWEDVISLMGAGEDWWE